MVYYFALSYYISKSLKIDGFLLQTMHCWKLSLNMFLTNFQSIWELLFQHKHRFPNKEKSNHWQQSYVKIAVLKVSFFHFPIFLWPPSFRPNGVLAIHALRQYVYRLPKCMSCHRAIVVITEREHCFHDCIYITLILLL